jgi:hypothetical protein
MQNGTENGTKFEKGTHNTFPAALKSLPTLCSPKKNDGGAVLPAAGWLEEKKKFRGQLRRRRRLTKFYWLHCPLGIG